MLTTDACTSLVASGLDVCRFPHDVIYLIGRHCDRPTALALAATCRRLRQGVGIAFRYKLKCVDDDKPEDQPSWGLETVSAAQKAVDLVGRDSEVAQYTDAILFDVPYGDCNRFLANLKLDCHAGRSSMALLDLLRFDFPNLVEVSVGGFAASFEKLADALAGQLSLRSVTIVGRDRISAWLGFDQSGAVSFQELLYIVSRCTSLDTLVVEKVRTVHDPTQPPPDHHVDAPWPDISSHLRSFKLVDYDLDPIQAARLALSQLDTLQELSICDRCGDTPDDPEFLALIEDLIASGVINCARPFSNRTSPVSRRGLELTVSAADALDMH